jgi:hypothetical protein
MMSLRHCRVIVTNPHLEGLHQRTGDVIDHRIHTELGLWLAVRFGDIIKMVSYKDVKIHPDDVKNWEHEAQKRWAYNEESRRGES